MARSSIPKPDRVEKEKNNPKGTEQPMAGLTVKSTPLLSPTPGGYTTSTPTLKGGAGELKPMTGSRATPVHRSAVSPFNGGKGSTKGKRHDFSNVARTVIPSVPDKEW